MPTPQAALVLPSTPISDMELETTFAATTDATQWWTLVDGDIVDSEWSSADVRRRAFLSLAAAGCGKRLVDGEHMFAFADGSMVVVDSTGIRCV